MEFDKTKVFTPFNADEVKVGSKGYFSDSKEELISVVQSENRNEYLTLNRIVDGNDYSFIIYTGASYRYFYLVEEPKEPKKRPCTKEEFIEMLKKQGIPMILCKDNGFIYSIVRLNGEAITVISVMMNSQLSYDYKELCDTFTLLDGTPLWVEE